MRRRCSHPATPLPGTHATQQRAATHPFYRRARAHVGPPPAGRAAPCSDQATRLLGTHATQLRAATHPFCRRARAHVGRPLEGRAAPCSDPATRLPGTHATQRRRTTHAFYRRARAHVGPVRAGRAAPWGITWQTPRLPRTTGRRCLDPCRWRRALCSAPPAPFFRCTTVASTLRVPRHRQTHTTQARRRTVAYRLAIEALSRSMPGGLATTAHPNLPPLAVPGRALPATTWEKVAVSTRPCHKYRFQLRVRYVQIIEFEYECWPRISSRVSIRNIP